MSSVGRCPSSIFLMKTVLHAQIWCDWQAYACMLILAMTTGVRAEVRFNRDVRPILSGKCFACHGPDAMKKMPGILYTRRTSKH